MIFDDLFYKNNKRYKDMTEDERLEHKLMKRRQREAQIKVEIAGVACLSIIILVIVLSVFRKNNNVPNEGISLADAEIESTEEGLKVTPPVSDVVISEEEPVTSQYSAKETETTAYIYQEDVISQYGLLINNDTKEIVAQKNGFDKIIPASMTKVMTVLTAANNITPEQLDEKIVLSDEAVAYCYKSGCSTSGFVAGEEVTVRDLFYGTILPSGGDAAAQLAMYVAGDIDSFMDLVNSELKDMGLSDTTHFTNPVGYYEDDHYSTCYDIAMIMMAALDNEICNEVLTTHVYYSSVTNINPEGIIISNWFLRRIEDRSFGGTISGAKTGYVNQSGSCAVSSEVSDSGTNYILVTAKSTSSWNCIKDHVTIYKNYAK